MAGDHDTHVPGGLTEPVECRLVGAHLTGAARVEERDQDVGKHVAGEQDATVREEQRDVADGMRLVLDDLARHWLPFVGSGRSAHSFLQWTPTRSPRHRPRRPDFEGGLGGRGGGVARNDRLQTGGARARGPSGDGWENPCDHRTSRAGHTYWRAVQLEPSMTGSTRTDPILAAQHD